MPPDPPSGSRLQHLRAPPPPHLYYRWYGTEKGNAEKQIYLPSFIHFGRTGFFIILSFVRVTPLTSWAVIFFVFPPSVQHSIKAAWNVCQPVSLSVSLGEAMSSDSHLSGSIDDVRDTSVFLLERSLLSPNLEIEAYSVITSVFGIPSFTSEPTICMNGWKRGERKPTQDLKHFW